jgi:hypothetical protein
LVAVNPLLALYSASALLWEAKIKNPFLNKTSIKSSTISQIKQSAVTFSTKPHPPRTKQKNPAVGLLWRELHDDLLNAAG